MKGKKILLDKLFPPPPNNQYNSLQIDNDSVSYITPPQLANTITDLIMMHCDTDLINNVLFDCTAGCGGDSISFGKRFGFVISSEINIERYQMLCNNVKVYDLKNIVPINCDSMKILHNLGFITIVYIDPPWGGADYKNHEKLRLKFSDQYIDEVVNQIFDQNIQNSHINMVCLKLPLNYDIESIYRNTAKSRVTIFMYRLEKLMILIIKKQHPPTCCSGEIIPERIERIMERIEKGDYDGSNYYKKIIDKFADRTEHNY